MITYSPDSVLLVFCKAPIAGQVKTRLQPELTADQAADAHRQLTRLTLDRAFQQRICDVRLCCSPDTTHQFFGQCEKDYPLTLSAQHGADLGERMLNAFGEVLSQYRSALLIGCDCPSLTPDDLQQALMALQNGSDAVIAPAEDGGYVLIGLNAPQPSLFESMDWGTEKVMEETRHRVKRASISIHELAEQWDVDTADDWARYLRS